MSGPDARVRGSPFTIDDAGTEPGLTCRLLLESDSPQARSLEGRPLAMYCSLMLPDRSRLRMSNLWPQRAPSPISSLAKEKEGLEKWNNRQR
jgi:hypothetical protein